MLRGRGKYMGLVCVVFLLLSFVLSGFMETAYAVSVSAGLAMIASVYLTKRFRLDQPDKNFINMTTGKRTAFKNIDALFFIPLRHWRLIFLIICVSAFMIKMKLN